jgi:glucose/arabinose dehydrogenase
MKASVVLPKPTLHTKGKEHSCKIMIVVVHVILGILIATIFYSNSVPYVSAAPSVIDPKLKIENFTTELPSYPTSMAFIDSNNLLVLHKGGELMLVSKGELQQEPVLKLPVNLSVEQGLLGIAISNDTEEGFTSNNPKKVFLYYTELPEGQGDGGEIRNRVYKYDWNGETLENPKLLLDLPVGSLHNGGKLLIGPDGYLYAIIGDQNPPVNRDDRWQVPIEWIGKLQNFADGPDPDDRGVIFRINASDGSPAADNPFSNDPNNPLSRYYAYGIRNSFGIDFDPVTGNLWDTENGPDVADEINLVKPGFNSGWQRVMGSMPTIPNAFTALLPNGVSEAELVNFNGSYYADPVVTFGNTIGITDIEFFESSRLGEEYTNNTFVGDIKHGNLYYFEVNPERSGFILHPRVTDWWGVGGSGGKGQLASVTFGTGFGGITDLETGPDGMLYVLSYGDRKIYRISAHDNDADDANGFIITSDSSNSLLTSSSSSPVNITGVSNETVPDNNTIPSNVSSSSPTPTPTPTLAPTTPYTSTSSAGPYVGSLQIPYTGLTRYHVTPTIGKLFGLNETTYAMIVTGVEPGSPAARAVIRSGNMTTNVSGDIIKVGGDMILAVDDNSSFIRNNEAFLNYLQNEKIVGENITLNILRDGQIHDIELTIEALPRFLWYENEDEGIRMKYPSDWRVSESDLSKQDIVKFFSPETTFVDNSTLSVASVFVKIRPSDIGLDSVARAQQEDTAETRNLDMFLTDVSNLPGYEKVFYDYSDRDRTLKILSVFTNKDEQLYTINFAADPTRYDDYLPLAREMINSFQFTK